MWLAAHSLPLHGPKAAQPWVHWHCPAQQPAALLTLLQAPWAVLQGACSRAGMLASREALGILGFI